MTPTERTTYYLEKLFWPFIGALIIACVTPITTIQWTVVAFAQGILAATIGLYTTRAGLHWKEAAIMAGLGGAVCALGFSVVAITLNFSVPSLFAIVPRMVISGAACGLLAGFTTEMLYVARRAQVKVQKKKTKKTAE